jgi:hypothetical protein
MGELLLSIGTFRRICGKKKDGQRGATTTLVESTRDVGRSHPELINGSGKTYRATRCSATPGEHPYCRLRATQKRWKMWGEGKKEGEEGEGKKKERGP